MEVDKFTGSNDFTLWRLKMKALLVHQGLADGIDPVRLIPDPVRLFIFRRDFVMEGING